MKLFVVGGGHAGYEAAHAAASMGARTALVTLSPDMIGQLSCNPSVGGIAKGHLVREIDALGGIIGRIADRTAIQFRLLNRSRGPAVQAPRTQNDKREYRIETCKILKNKDLLDIIKGEASTLTFSQGRLTGIELADGSILESQAVILATGTFLKGRCFIGTGISSPDVPETSLQICWRPPFGDWTWRSAASRLEPRLAWTGESWI